MEKTEKIMNGVLVASAASLVILSVVAGVCCVKETFDPVTPNTCPNNNGFMGGGSDDPGVDPESLSAIW